jgi:ABC-type sugar transport system substrate-binding protein
MKAAAKDRGVDLIVSDAAADASKHVSHIEDFIAQGVDAIIISPVDQEAPVDAVKAAKEAGIVVVSLDQEVRGSDAFYGIDEFEYGHMGGVIAGEWLNSKDADGTIDEVLDADGKIEVVVARYDMIKSVIDRAEGLKAGIVDAYTATTKSVRLRAERRQRRRGLQPGRNRADRQPEISVFICINDSGALGVYEPACSTRSTPRPTPASWALDALEEPLKLISEDTMYKGTVDIQPAQKGGEVLDIVEKVIASAPSPTRSPTA